MRNEFTKKASGIILSAFMTTGCMPGMIKNMPMRDTAATFGAIAGGVVGNEVAGTVGAVVGAVAGAALGNATGSDCESHMTTRGTRRFTGTDNNAEYSNWGGTQTYKEDCKYRRQSDQGRQGLPTGLLQ